MEVISPAAEAIMAKNMMNTLKRFIELDIKQLNKEETIFVRKWKIMSFGIDYDDVPEKFKNNLVTVPTRTLAAEWGVSRDRFRIREGGFERKNRRSTVSKDPDIIKKIRNYFELPENSSQVLGLRQKYHYFI